MCPAALAERVPKLENRPEGNLKQHYPMVPKIVRRNTDWESTTIYKGNMKGDRLEKWRALCEQAAKEQDPDRLMKPVQEIARLLEVKKERLRNQKSS